MANDPASNSADSGLSQADIDAALASAGDGGAEPPLAELNAAVDAVLAQTAPATTSAEAGLSQADIDAALGTVSDGSTTSSAGHDADPPDSRLDSSGRPFDAAAAAMAEAIAEEKAAAQSAQASPRPAIQSKPMNLQDFGAAGLSTKGRGSIDLLQDVEMNVTIELGRARMNVEDVLKLGEGSIVELDKLAGDPVDVLVNDRIVARGEVLILNDAFSVRINEILSGQNRLAEIQAGAA